MYNYNVFISRLSGVIATRGEWSATEFEWLGECLTRSSNATHVEQLQIEQLQTGPDVTTEKAQHEEEKL